MVKKDYKLPQFNRSKILAISLALLFSFGLVLAVSLEGRMSNGNKPTSDSGSLIGGERVSDGTITKEVHAASCTQCWEGQWVPCTDCVFNYHLVNGYCCPNDMSHCGSCTPGTPTGYQPGNNGCSTTTNTCNIPPTGFDCGTDSATFYRLKYNVSYNANGGTGCTGNTQVCGNTGTPAAGCSRSGYSVNYTHSGGCTGTFNSATGACSSITDHTTITANWILNNQAPTAPSSLRTNDLSNPTGVTTTVPKFSAIFNDPDSGNTGVYYQIQVDTNSSFTGTRMWNGAKTSMTATAIGSRSPDINYGGTTLTQNGATYYWRIKFWDNNGGESPWSDTANFTMNTAPTAPTVLFTDGQNNPTAVGATPYFSAIYNDADSGDKGKHYQIQVNTNFSFSGTTMWDSGQTGMSDTTPGNRSPNINYAGSTLNLNGTTYYWRIRFWDSKDAQGAWSATANFTTATGGPAPTVLRTNGSSTPPTNVVPNPYFSAQFNHGDSTRRARHYRIIVRRGSTIVWNSNKTSISDIAPGNRSPNITYAGSTPLEHDGATYTWTISFWDDLGVETAVSDPASFTMNLRPSPPTSLLTNGLTNPSGVTTLTPSFSAIYNDTSGKQANKYRIQVSRSPAFSTTVWDTTQTMTALNAGNRIPNKTYAGNTLVLDGSRYYWRIKFWDTLGGEGEWSDASDNYFTMKNNNKQVTIGPFGTQISPMYINSSLGSPTNMGGGFSLEYYSDGLAFMNDGKISSITMSRTWFSGGSGDITAARISYSTVNPSSSCPSQKPVSATVFASVTNPFRDGNATFTTSTPPQLGNTVKFCGYVEFTFGDYNRLESGSILDFSITNIGTVNTHTVNGLPSNILGTTTFVLPPTPPSFYSISNDGPKNPGVPIQFSASAQDDNGDLVKLVVCKTSGFNGEGCSGGESDTYCESDWKYSDPSCQWANDAPSPDRVYSAYPYIVDSTGLSATGSLQGQAHSFTINNVAPTVKSISIEEDPDSPNSIRLITGTTKAVTINTSIEDINGKENGEIAEVKAYFYRSGVGYAGCNSGANANPNNCYPAIPCSINTTTSGGGSPSSMLTSYKCTANLVHYTDPTVEGAPFADEDWRVTIVAKDNGFGSGGTSPLTGSSSQTSGVEVDTLLAFDITGFIDYGNQLVGVPTNPLNIQTVITSGGNICLNHSLWGADMCQDFPACSGYRISSDSQRYSLAPLTEYEDGTPLSTDMVTTLTNLPKQVSSSPTTRTIWWGINVPVGTVTGEYFGENYLDASIAY